VGHYCIGGNNSEVIRKYNEQRTEPQTLLQGSAPSQTYSKVSKLCRRGNCHDNACAEIFFSLLKKERGDYIDILKMKYLNNIVEQDHRFITKITKLIMEFKVFHSARATLARIQTAHMISKGLFANNQLPAHQQFIACAV
jgi:transposase-like protein